MEIILSLLAGFMAGVVVCAKYLRHEFAGILDPRLKHIEQQLHILREETNLDAAARLTALNQYLEDPPPRK